MLAPLLKTSFFLPPMVVVGLTRGWLMLVVTGMPSSSVKFYWVSLKLM